MHMYFIPEETYLAWDAEPGDIDLNPVEHGGRPTRRAGGPTAIVLHGLLTRGGPRRITFRRMPQGPIGSRRPTDTWGKGKLPST